MLSYKDLKFPKPPKERPYVIVNMVMTLDGKVRSGRHWPLGSQTDYRLMKELRTHANVLLLGGVTARKWRKKIEGIKVVVISRSTNQGKKIDLKELLAKMRQDGVKILLVEGGPNINWQLFEQNLVEELFLTISPKILGGRDYKTIVDGKQYPIPRRGKLVSVYTHDNELFLRYSFNNG